MRLAQGGSWSVGREGAVERALGARGPWSVRLVRGGRGARVWREGAVESEFGERGLWSAGNKRAVERAFGARGPCSVRSA